MVQRLALTYFTKQPQFKFKPGSVFIFIILAFVAWEINVLGQTFFPSQNLLPYIIRTIITLITDMAFIALSIRLLKQNYITGNALGLFISKKTIPDVLLGVFIGTIAVLTIAVLLYAFVPYHFVTGPLSGVQVFKESMAYLVGNTLEELMFRGFLFIIISQLTGWRTAILILALPFGLFHLQGTGFSIDGLKMVATTAAYSFIFCLSYVLTRSI